jgi:hypothetical protein
MTPKFKPFIKRYKVRKDAVTQDLMAFTLKVIAWLLTRFPGVSNQLVKELRTLAATFVEISKTRGVTGMMTYVKSLRQSYYIYLSGEYPSKKVPGIRVTSDGLPIALTGLDALINRCHSDSDKIPMFRMITTLLSATRSLTKVTDPDTSSITAPPIVVSPYPEIPKPDGFWRALGFRLVPSPKVPKVLNFRNYHFSSKSGPNGHALGSSIADLSLISLNKALLDAIRTVGGPKLTLRIDTLLTQLPFVKAGHPKFPERDLRKLSVIPDKEHKVRVVAILDYFSQTALYPFHVYLYRVLKRIPQDCTHNQGSFKEKIKGWEVFHSVDLTAATDRFPLTFIKFAMKPILPQSYLDAWEFIMVGLPFRFTTRNEVKYLRYSVGTPMGAYTS